MFSTCSSDAQHSTHTTAQQQQTCERGNVPHRRQRCKSGSGFTNLSHKRCGSGLATIARKNYQGQFSTRVVSAYCRFSCVQRIHQAPLVTQDTPWRVEIQARTRSVGCRHRRKAQTFAAGRSSMSRVQSVFGMKARRVVRPDLSICSIARKTKLRT